MQLLAHLALLLAISTAHAAVDLSVCKAAPGASQTRCQTLKKTCNTVTANAPMKWTGTGCTVGGVGQKDAGCQCDGYCGYKCLVACNRDTQCMWQDGVCKNKATGEVGTAIPDCRITSTPTALPSSSPSTSPTTAFPTTKAPSRKPTKLPTNRPSKKPTKFPTPRPTRKPTPAPHPKPTKFPTPRPTKKPTPSPVFNPTKSPTPQPIPNPTASPTPEPTPKATKSPLGNPTKSPSPKPTVKPTRPPTPAPTPPTPEPPRAWSQQGNKLVGTGTVGQAYQGSSVAISYDGNTAIVGGPQDKDFKGAAWIFTRSASSTWSQQGAKLVPSGTTGTKSQAGKSVAMSGDGNTALVGGFGDNSGLGAFWVFARSQATGAWSQQGGKLVGSGSLKLGAIQVNQGFSVAISSDGNTAIVGGPGDNGKIGAAWVFSRSQDSTKWSQQGKKLVGGGYIGYAGQGAAVALSADGSTAIVGGTLDNSQVGASWVFVRAEDGTWSQQGDKLVGSDVSGPGSNQGSSVALSADGNTALVGGPSNFNLYVGSAWVFVRYDGTWYQQGSLLLGSGSSGIFAFQGCSVSLSADGNTAAIGGRGDSGGWGAVWIFVRENEEWLQQGEKVAGADAAGVARQGISLAVSGEGNTVIAGGTGDSGDMGAAWIFQGD